MAEGISAFFAYNHMNASEQKEAVISKTKKNPQPKKKKTSTNGLITEGTVRHTKRKSLSASKLLNSSMKSKKRKIQPAITISLKNERLSGLFTPTKRNKMNKKNVFPTLKRSTENQKDVLTKSKDHSDEEMIEANPQTHKSIKKNIGKNPVAIDILDSRNGKIRKQTLANNRISKTSSKKESNNQNENIHQIDAIYKINDSIERGKEMFSWIISPITINEFFEKNWEQKPCLIQRNCPSYYKDLLSLNSFYKMLCDERVEFTKNLDVTSYVDGVRETHNPEGRALPPIVKDFYDDGCSLRLLNPQTFLTKIHAMNATLQEFFQCMTGANIYITPPNSQGFAPHYDDIEAFVLQIEGKKHWKLYKPRSGTEYLPRYSSKNFEQNEIGEPVLNVILEPGDLLYFPRGTIHQATTVPGIHSMHITLSVYQKQSYADLMEILLPLALKKAIRENINFRQGLPLDIWQTMGIVNENKNTTQQRTQIQGKIKSLLLSMVEHINPTLDNAVDHMAVRFQYDALPPFLNADEKLKTVFNPDLKSLKINPISHVRLTRANILRLVQYEDELRVYFNVDNSKEYHEYEQNYLQINDEDAPAIEYLCKLYPNYVKVEDLPLKETERKIDVIQDLWERGLLMVKI